MSENVSTSQSHSHCEYKVARVLELDMETRSLVLHVYHRGLEDWDLNPGLTPETLSESPVFVYVWG